MPLTLAGLTDIELLNLSIQIDENSKSEIARFKDFLSRDLDWDYVGKDLIDNRLAGFFYYNLIKTETTHLIPQQVLEQFSSITAKITAENILFFNAFKEMAELFHERQIDFIVLKGMALYFTVYKTRPFRDMADIDLLVNESQLDRVKNALSDLGYEISSKDHPSKWHSEILSPVLKELPYEKKTVLKNIYVDIHWGLTKGVEATAIDKNRLWNNLISLKVDGIKVSILSPESLIIHLCIHLYKDLILKKAPLLWFCDIIETMRFYRNDINWHYLIESIAKEGLDSIIYPILAKLYALKLIKFPKIMESKIWPFIKMGVLTEQNLRSVKKDDEGKYYIGLISNINGLRNKVLFIVSLIFPSPRQLNRYYPSKDNSMLFCYLYHWQRTFVKIYRSFKNLLSRG